MSAIDELKTLLLETLIRELKSADEVDPRILSTARAYLKDFQGELENIDPEDEQTQQETLKRFLDRRREDREK